jgi:environmental stress-induced protein Ves
MTWQLIQLADTLPSPWKNGGGFTRELVAWPNTQDWLWRMSVAEVALSGPFSHFEGVQRWFAVLSGAGVKLDMGLQPHNASHNLTPTSDPLNFAGDELVHCTLIDGPTQDFNLMLRAGHASACMMRVNGSFTSWPNTTTVIAVYAGLAGAVVHFDDETLILPPHTLAWASCPAGGRLQVQSENALWMEIGL